MARRGRDSAVQVVAFGLGLTVLLLLTLVRTDLLEGWRETLDSDAPNHFLINIQPEEVAPLGSFFTERGFDCAGIYAAGACAHDDYQRRVGQGARLSE